MVGFLKKNILEIISIFVAFAALCLSIKVAVYNRTSRQIINKPELVVRLVKFEDTGTFLKCSRNGRTVFFEYSLQIKNKGNIAARNVTFPDKPFLPEFEEEKAQYKEHQPITIEQGESVFAISGFEIQFSYLSGAIKMMDLAGNQSWPGITFSVEVKYKSDLEPEIQYIKKVGFQISKEDALLLVNE